MGNLVVHKGVTDQFRNFLIESLLRNAKIYFVFGGSTAWPNEIPEEVTGIETKLLDPLTFVKASIAAPVIETQCNYQNLNTQVTIQGVTWSILQLDNINPNGQLPVNIYLAAQVSINQVPHPQIRNLSIVLDPTLKEGVNPNLTNYEYSDIDFPGYLIYVANFTPIAIDNCGAESTKFGVIINI